MKNILIKNKKIIGVISAFVFFLFGKINVCHAALDKDAVDILIGFLAKKVVSAAGWFLGKIIGLVVDLAQYDNYVRNPQVGEAWMIVRDFCNMFFILILLFIAFAVMLRIESYSIKKSLPKLLIMAVLINFSKTICGLLIDLSQIVMLTFVSAFTDGSGNFYAHLHVNDFLTAVNNEDDAALGAGDAAAMYLLAVVFMIVSVVTMLAILMVFLMRVIMFWIYIVLSPLAFMLSAFPAGQKYASQYWGEFTKYLINGPVLAFFIWMSLSVLANLDTGALGKTFPESTVGIMKGDNFAGFIMAIGMLVGGLMISSQIGGIGASWGASTVSNLKNRGLSMAKQGAIGLTKGAILPAKTLASFGIDKLHEKQGVDLNLPRAWKTLKAKREDKRVRRYAEGMNKAGQVMTSGGRIHGMLAMTGAPGDAWDMITKHEGFKLTGLAERWRGGEKNKEIRDKLLPGVKQAEFERDYIGKTIKEKDSDFRELEKERVKIEDEINKETDPDKKAERQKEKDAINKKLEFAGKNRYVKYGDLSDDKKSEYNNAAKEKRKEFEKYIPSYTFEAKGAEEKAVAGEYDKIRKIDDADELVRMLKDAIKGREKSRIKAIMRKLAADANDNEFLEALAPDIGSGYEGLQAVMDGLSDSNNKSGLYAGFDKQEAYSLGAQIAEMNKKTNHWEATAAYMMENGEWRKATDDEHTHVASTEFGKKNPRANARDSNRLALGKHVVDPATGEKTYQLTNIGKIMLQSWNNPTSIDKMLEDMTESTAKHLVPFLKGLEEQKFFTAKGKGNYNLADVIRQKAGMAENFDAQLSYIKGIEAKRDK